MSDWELQRISDLERRVAALEQHLGVAGPPASAADTNTMWDEVTELVRAGKKIDAIKIVQERTGTSLREAKKAVDALDL